MNKALKKKSKLNFKQAYGNSFLVIGWLYVCGRKSKSKVIRARFKEMEKEKLVFKGFCRRVL